MSFPSARCGDGDVIPEVGVYRVLGQIANEVGVYRVLGFFEEDQQIADEDVARQLWKTFQHVFGSDHNRPDTAGVEFRLRLLGFDTQVAKLPNLYAINVLINEYANRSVRCNTHKYNTLNKLTTKKDIVDDLGILSFMVCLLSSKLASSHLLFPFLSKSYHLPVLKPRVPRASSDHYAAYVRSKSYIIFYIQSSYNHHVQREQLLVQARHLPDNQAFIVGFPSFVSSILIPIFTDFLRGAAFFNYSAEMLAFKEHSNGELRISIETSILQLF
ncbi:predicted protein [Nematostella vectensis]|uniref:Uncharacterized protein n=1 Tax=Nematostella vectensis TaxID=45351 RepID=A7RRB7_NEMVE|nr:predicted protein [Nematostella vectensis]|eukprot:XP_001638046.1 predicted protein [Nematostella vectensis]